MTIVAVVEAGSRREAEALVQDYVVQMQNDNGEGREQEHPDHEPASVAEVINSVLVENRK